MQAFIVKLGKGVGKVVGTLYQAGRDAIDQVIKNVLPFMAFIAFIIGLITDTGIGDWIAEQFDGAGRQHDRPADHVDHHQHPGPVPPARAGGGHRPDHRHSDRHARSAWATSRRRWRCPPCGPSTHRWGATSSRSDWRSVRPSRIRSRSEFRRCCSAGWSPGRWPFSSAGCSVSGSTAEPFAEGVSHGTARPVQEEDRRRRRGGEAGRRGGAGRADRSRPADGARR